MAKTEKLPPITPGEMLLTEFLESLKLSQNQLATEIRVTTPRINHVIKNDGCITPELAVRLGRFFRTGPEFWLNLQQRYDLEMTKDEFAEKVERTIEPIDESILDDVLIS